MLMNVKSTSISAMVFGYMGRGRKRPNDMNKSVLFHSSPIRTTISQMHFIVVMFMTFFEDGRCELSLQNAIRRASHYCSASVVESMYSVLAQERNESI